MTGKSPEELVEIGIAYGEEGEYAKAIECFEKAVELDDDNIDAHYNMGVIFGKLYLEDIVMDEFGEDLSEEDALLARAELEYNKVLALAPDYEEAKNNLELLQDAADKKIE